MILTLSRKESEGSLPITIGPFAPFIRLQSYFYPCTDSATAHTTREWVLQYRKIDRFEAQCYQAGANDTRTGTSQTVPEEAERA